MNRALTVCALLSLGVANAFAQVLPDTYSLKMREVQKEGQLLLNHLEPSLDFDLFKPDLHYVAMLGVTMFAAQSLAVPGPIVIPTEVFYDVALNDHLPEVLANPFETVQDVKDLVSTVNDKLRVLSQEMDHVCQDLSDFECDKLVHRRLRRHPELAKSASVLQDIYPFATLLASKDQRQREVAESLDVIPYLVYNKPDVVELIEELSKVIRRVKPLL